MGNRPKIYVDAYRYIYRSDYNIFKHNNRYRSKDQKRTEEEILDLCHKYSHELEGFKKGDIVTLTALSGKDVFPYYGLDKNAKFEIMRIDYNGYTLPDIVLVRPIGWYGNVPIKIGDTPLKDLFTKI